MLVELGPLRIATGAHRTTTAANPLVAKAAAEAVPNPVANEQIAVLTTQALGASVPAGGYRPSPGPLPPANQPQAPALRSQFPINVNQIWTPRTDFRQDSFGVLEAFADMCYPVRICVDTRKDQMAMLDWDIVTRDKDVKPDRGKVAALRTFFESPDGRLGFEDWLRAANEEVLVKDALTLYRRKTRKGGLAALEIIDGKTIKVLLDETGQIPFAPAKAYRQIMYGAPTQLGDYTRDEMYYLPRTVRTKTPYGMSPVETILLTLTTIINRQVFQLGYYAEGNIPAGLIEIANATTAEQIAEMQQYLDSTLNGNLAARHRLKVVPPKSVVHEFSKPDWSVLFDEFLVKIVCAAFAVPPSEIGFTADVNRATAKQQENIVYRRGVKPMARYWKSVFDRVLANDLDAAEYEMAFTGGEPEDKLTQAKVDQIYVGIGKTGIDELRNRDGQDALGVPPYIMTTQGPLLVRDLAAQAAAPAAPLDALGLPGEPQPAGDVPVAEDGQASDDTGAPAPEERRGGAGRDIEKAVASELRTWRAVALKDAKHGRPARAFVAKAIPPAPAAVIAARLDRARSMADVVKVFDAALVRKAHVAERHRKPQVAALQARMSDYFGEMGGALARHVSHELGR